MHTLSAIWLKLEFLLGEFPAFHKHFCANFARCQWGSARRVSGQHPSDLNNNTRQIFGIGATSARTGGDALTSQKMVPESSSWRVDGLELRCVSNESEREGEETGLNEHNSKCSNWNHLSRTLQLGRPGSPREKSYHSIEAAEQVLSSRQELRLNNPLEENQHIFDERQSDSAVNAMVKRWKNKFKGFDQDKRGPLASLEHEIRYFIARAPIKGMERDEKFKDQVDQYALLNPSCRNQVKKQLTVLEEQLRKDRLLWLQVCKVHNFLSLPRLKPASQSSQRKASKPA